LHFIYIETASSLSPIILKTIAKTDGKVTFTFSKQT